jgi:release factor glutamine methyltransferase
MPTLGEISTQAAQQLATLSDSPRLDAELLIADCLKISRSRFISNPESELDAQQLDLIQTSINRRARGEPVAYILGHKHFWDLQLSVSPAVLIPRPDTELLVETALTLYPAETAINVIDLGTGSGAIALAIAKARPHWHISATDESQAALALAIENAERYQLHNVSLLQSHWFDSLGENKKYELMISNPPYVAENDPHLQQGDVRFEPQSALVAGVDGLAAIRYLIPHSKPHLVTGGWLLLEHGYDQGERVHQLFIEHGYLDVQQKQDLAGHVRVTLGRG